MINDSFMPELEDVNVDELWFQHDGAVSFRAALVRCRLRPRTGFSPENISESRTSYLMRDFAEELWQVERA